MPVTKIIQAQDILKEKGYKQPKFDTMGFQSAVVNFFRKNDVSARLHIIAVRFAELSEYPAAGFISCTEVVRVVDDEEQYDVPKILVEPKHIINEYNDIHPVIYIDEPYVNNAVGLLKMCGFIVGRKKKTYRLPSYPVTLV